MRVLWISVAEGEGQGGGGENWGEVLKVEVLASLGSCKDLQGVYAILISCDSLKAIKAYDHAGRVHGGQIPSACATIRSLVIRHLFCYIKRN